MNEADFDPAEIFKEPAELMDVPAQSNLTTAQFLIWIGQKLNPGSPLYNMVLTFRINGKIQTDLFQEAFQALIDGSDALRTVILEEDGIPQRNVLESLPYQIPYLDMTDSADPAARFAKWAEEKAQDQLDLSARLFDSALIKLDSEVYAWYLNKHHLITDGWSSMVIYRHMAAFYDKAVQQSLDQAAPLPEFEKYVTFERQHADNAQFKEAKAYWQEKLAEPFAPTEFYGKLSEDGSTRTKRIRSDLGPERSKKIKDIAQEKGIRALTLDMSLLNIFITILFAYLHRISGNKTPRIGAPFHNRPRAEFRETIGLFIEICLLKINIEEGETFLSLFKKVQQEVGTVIRYAQPGTSSSISNRSYDVLLNYINASFPDFSGHSVDPDWVHAGHGDRHHKFRLQVHDFGRTGTFMLAFDLNTDFFDKQDRRYIVEHFLMVLDAFIADRNQPIGKIDLLTAEEHQRLLIEPNQTQNPYPADQTIIELFEAQVTRTPDSVAAACEGSSLTYDQLNQRANQLAHLLRDHGVQVEDRVGICMERSLEFIVGVLGIIKSGAAYVPIDSAYPQERLSFMLSDMAAGHSSEMPVLLTQAQLVDRLPVGVAEIIHFDQNWDLLDSYAADKPANGPGPQNLVYIIYTSGSTGQPKGVMIEHRGLVNYIWWAKKVYVGDEVFDFPLFSSISFDLTVTSIYTPLISGGKIMVYPEEEHARGLEILRVIEDNAVDILKLTPSHLALVRDYSHLASRINKLIVGGEDFKTELAQAITDRYDGQIKIYNEYGPTETVVGCMIHQYDSTIDTGPSVSIGRPADNVQIYILDSAGRPVPPAVIAEIFIAGDGVGRGYLNRSSQTAARFLPDPFREGSRMYRTGDRGRWTAAGTVDFLGRLDHQVKLRGARIELGEVKSALLNHSQVSAAVADVVEVVRQTEPRAHCVRCGLPDNFPDADLDEHGVCSDCRTYARYKAQVERYFRTPADLREKVQVVKAANADKPVDCMVLVSGGKDSSYLVYQLVRTYGLRPLVFSLDNGYISEQALSNIRNICDHLDVELVIGRTPHMNDIFADSLKRHSSVCDGCFKTIYTLSMTLARKRGIRTIFTGLARGQLFETRLADTFHARVFDPTTIDHWVMEARKAYHQIDDAVNQLLETDLFQDDRIFGEIEFVDFYRYVDVTLDEVYDYLVTESVWQRPADTGRSTNCLINDVGIYIHKKERGHHNYALPYSWDVRLGHKQREAAMDELDDDIQVDSVQQILSEIGYDENAKAAQRAEKRLVAYYTVSDSALTVRELRTHLAERLPDFMIPFTFIRLDAIPLTANGKVDRAALPHPDISRPELETNYVAPSTAREAMLAKIWSEVFRLQEIGVQDNFFDLGGDSIISIQIVARARLAGLTITPRQMFEHQTIALLAAAATESEGVPAEQGLVTGSIPLTPIQRWFFDQDFIAPQEWNQSILLEMPADVDADALQEALQFLPEQHDSLRLRFTKTEDGWLQMLPESVPIVPFEVIDLSDVAFPDQKAALGTITARLEALIDLAAGDLIQTALIQRGPGRPKWLFLTVHHLAIDSVSWGPLLADLEQAYNQILQRQPVSLPPKTTSFKTFAERLVTFVDDNTDRSHLDHWQQLPAPSPLVVPTTAETIHTTEIVSITLDAEQTKNLLLKVPAAYNTNMNDALLTAWALAWASEMGEEVVSVMLEGHGREEAVIGGVDLTRTVGWFTTQHPVHLSIAGAVGPGPALRAVKEQLRSVPGNGLHYGLLRYLHPAAPLADHPEPSMLFNYLGQFERALPSSPLFSLARPLEAAYASSNRLTHALEINAYLQQEKLHVNWVFSPRQLSPALVQSLADQFLSHLKALIEHCLSDDAGSKTVSDFDLLDISDDQFDQLAQMLGQLGK